MNTRNEFRAFLVVVLAAGPVLMGTGCRDIQGDGARPDTGGDADSVAADAEVDVPSDAADAEVDAPSDATQPGWCPPSEPNPSVPTVAMCGETLYGTDAQFASTPRNQVGTEMLVLEAVDAFVAPDCLYERVRDEVGSIREEYLDGAEPDVDFQNRKAPSFGRALTMFVDAETADTIEAGNYEWGCLNEHYEKKTHAVEEIDMEGNARVVVEFEGTYDMERVVESYRTLPGLIERNGDRVRPGAPTLTTGGPRGDICLEFRGADGRSSRYAIYVERLRDDPVKSAYFEFSVAPDGSVEQKNAYRSEQSIDRPDWLSDICD